MIRLSPFLPILMTAACATARAPTEMPSIADSAPPVVDVDAVSSIADETALLPTESAAVAALDAKEVTIDELDNGLVCEQRQRPGSRMTQTYCYTREEQTADQEARQEQIQALLRNLDREQRNHETYERMAEEERQRAMMIIMMGRPD